MAIIINKIELNNWFCYEGTFEDNTFEFTSGVNIIIASNDIGKSKLHNAFRWLICDEIILQKDKKFEIINIDDNNIKDVLNYNAANKLKHDESVTLAVRLTFEETYNNPSRGNSMKRITKKLVCRKNVNAIEIVRLTADIEQYNGRNFRTTGDTLDDITKTVIRENLREFFLVQGESVQYLTPLKGKSLTTTINNLVNLQELDKRFEASKKSLKNITELRQNIETTQIDLDQEERKNIESKTKIENQITEIEETELPSIESFITECQITIEKYKSQAAVAQNQKQLKKKIDDFNSSIQQLEGSINAHYKRLFNNYINGDFYLSKLFNNQDENEFLNSYKTIYKDFAAQRRTELDDTLSTKEQDMLYALQKDQPSIRVLQAMVNDGTCFVCSSQMNEINKKYINEKLIPFFKNELNSNDSELKKYEDLNDCFLQLDGYLKDYGHYNNKFLDQIINQIIQDEDKKKTINNDKEEFIRENGIISDDDIDTVSLAGYDKAILEKERYNTRKNSLEKELSDLNDQLRKIREPIARRENIKLQKAVEIESFFKDLTNAINQIRAKTYKNFSKRLEEIANKKFNTFTEPNNKFNNQKIVVTFSLDTQGTPHFEIEVKDQFGNSLQQGGGASQTVRQLSVIFGLIEIADGNVNYPFIADAPSSNMTADLTEHFFKYQLEKATTQNILITKELWDDKKYKEEGDGLNEMGNRILEIIRKNKSSQLVEIVFNDTTNRLKINKID